MNNVSIPTYVINLARREDRRNSILDQFLGKPEFLLHIVDAIEHPCGALGLWNSLYQIVESLQFREEEYIIICEDDHCFTDYYSKEVLWTSILDGVKNNADVLIGGASSVRSLFAVSSRLIWIEGYTGNQFMVIFKKFFDKILASRFLEGEQMDHKFSAMSDQIFLIYPFISIQKEFGYSDVTPKNGISGHVSGLFMATSASVMYILETDKFYKSVECLVEKENYDGYVLPTYVVRWNEAHNSFYNIRCQFENRPEFDVTYIESHNGHYDNFLLWESIKEIIRISSDNDEDVVIICGNDHTFSDLYESETLFKNIVFAHKRGVDILLGSTYDGFGHALPVGNGIFWINQFVGARFFVVYKKFYSKIIEAIFTGSSNVDMFLSEMTTNKMVIHPFISTNLHSSDPPTESEGSGSNYWASRMFDQTSMRLLKLRTVYNRIYL